MLATGAQVETVAEVAALTVVPVRVRAVAGHTSALPSWPRTALAGIRFSQTDLLNPLVGGVSPIEYDRSDGSHFPRHLFTH